MRSPCKRSRRLVGVKELNLGAYSKLAVAFRSLWHLEDVITKEASSLVALIAYTQRFASCFEILFHSHGYSQKEFTLLM